MREEQLILRKAFVTVSNKILTDTAGEGTGGADGGLETDGTGPAAQSPVGLGDCRGVLQTQCWVPPCSAYSLMVWMMGTVYLQKFADYTKLSGVADTSKGHAAIQRDINRQENLAHRSLVKFATD